MFVGRSLQVVVLSLASIVWCAPATRAQSSQPTEKEFWPALYTNVDLSPRFRLQGIIEKRDGEENEFLLWRVGALFSYHAMRRIKRPNADIEEEDRHYMVLAAGYEFLKTSENGVSANEHRVIAQFTPKRTVGASVLLQDRNRLEFCWKNGVYNFRYRNKVTVDRPLSINEVTLIPYASGEWFWNRNASAWNQNRLAVGVRVPLRKSLVIDPYYMRKNCTGCERSALDIFGLAVNWYFNRAKR